MKKVCNKTMFLLSFLYVLIIEKLVLSGIFSDDEEIEEVGNLYGKDKIPQRKGEDEKGGGSGKNKNIPKDDKSAEEILAEEEAAKNKEKKDKKETETDDDEGTKDDEKGKVVVNDVEYDYDKVYEKAVAYFDDVDFTTLSKEKVQKYITQYVNSDDFEENEEELKAEKKKDKEEKDKKDSGKAGDIQNPVKIGGVTYSYDEIFEKTKEYFEDINFEKLSDEKKARYVKDYISSAHFKEGEKSLSKKHREASDAKKEVERLQEEAKVKLEEAEEKSKEITKELEDLKKKKADIQKILDKKLDDELDDDEKEDLRIDKKLKKKELEELEEDEKKALKKYDNLIIQSWIDEMQALPGLQTTKHPYDILQASKTSVGRKTIKKEELRIATGIKKVLKDYNQFLKENEDAELSIVEFYQDRDYNYPELAAALSAAEDIDNEDKDDKTPDLSKLKASEMLNRLTEKQKLYKPIPSGGGKTSIEKKKDDSDEPEVKKEDLGYSTGGSAGRYHHKG